MYYDIEPISLKYSLASCFLLLASYFLLPAANNLSFYKLSNILINAFLRSGHVLKSSALSVGTSPMPC